MYESGRRLTSWKEIAAHFGREVRTVMRWEKERALPVHRGPDGKTGVVFADTAELDAWARGPKTPEAIEPAAPPVTPPVPVARGADRRLATAAGLVLATAIGLGGWRVNVSRANAQPAGGVMTQGAVIALHADGSEKWRHTFEGERDAPPFSRMTNPLELIAGEGLVAATSDSVTTDKFTIRSGRLTWFEPDGTPRQSFSFQDSLHRLA